MKIYKFGPLSAKRFLQYDGKFVKIKTKKSTLSNLIANSIDVVYIIRPTKSSRGRVQFSINDPQQNIGDPLLTKSFLYTKKQEDEVNEFLLPLKDIIEEVEAKVDYETTLTYKTQQAAKESQKEALRRRKAKEQSKLNQNIVRCSNCHSKNVEFVGNKKKNFSVGKAVAGNILVPGAGALAGFAGKKGKKNNWHCKDCGSLFVK